MRMSTLFPFVESRFGPLEPAETVTGFYSELAESVWFGPVTEIPGSAARYQIAFGFGDDHVWPDVIWITASGLRMGVKAIGYERYPLFRTRSAIAQFQDNLESTLQHIATEERRAEQRRAEVVRREVSFTGTRFP